MNQKLLIGFIALLLLAALGGGGYYYFSQQGTEIADDQKGSVPEGITPIVDVDDILNHTAEEVDEYLGKSTQRTLIPEYDLEEVLWEQADLSIVATRSGQRPFHEVGIGFSKSFSETVAFALVGMKPPQYPPQPAEKNTLASHWYFVGKYGEVDFRTDLEDKTVSIRATNKDFLRKKQLNNVAHFLESYIEDKSAYPSSADRLEFWNSQDVESTVLSRELYPRYVGLTYLEEKLPLPPEGEQYGYRSDGPTYYELTAALDDSNDPECVIENDMCIYRIRNGEVVSKK